MEWSPGGPPCRARAGGMAALGPRKAAVKVGGGREDSLSPTAQLPQPQLQNQHRVLGDQAGDALIAIGQVGAGADLSAAALCSCRSG